MIASLANNRGQLRSSNLEINERNQPACRLLVSDVTLDGRRVRVAGGLCLTMS
jgi:hypothetical protein